MLWEILVPTTSNDGRKYLVEYHRQWDRLVEQLAGGLTIHPIARGVWVSASSGENAQVFREHMIPVRIACTEAVIRRIMKLTLAYYDQQAIMAYQVSTRCLLLRAPRKKKRKRRPQC